MALAQWLVVPVRRAAYVVSTGVDRGSAIALAGTSNDSWTSVSCHRVTRQPAPSGAGSHISRLEAKKVNRVDVEIMLSELIDAEAPSDIFLSPAAYKALTHGAAAHGGIVYRAVRITRDADLVGLEYRWEPR